MLFLRRGAHLADFVLAAIGANFEPRSLESAGRSHPTSGVTALPNMGLHLRAGFSD